MNKLIHEDILKLYKEFLKFSKLHTRREARLIFGDSNYSNNKYHWFVIKVNLDIVEELEKLSEINKWCKKRGLKAEVHNKDTIYIGLNQDINYDEKGEYF